MKVGDLVCYRGDPEVVGMIMGVHVSIRTYHDGERLDFWHVFWFNDGSEHWKIEYALTHEDEHDINKLSS